MDDNELGGAIKLEADEIMQPVALEEADNSGFRAESTETSQNKAEGATDEINTLDEPVSVTIVSCNNFRSEQDFLMNHLFVSSKLSSRPLFV